SAMARALRLDASPVWMHRRSEEMMGGEPMSLTAADLEELKSQLRERAVSLRKEMESKLDEATGEAHDAGARGDSGDRSFAAAESEVDAGEAQRDQGELGAIERTLARIEDGSYGDRKSVG